jgi:hypothetical protein
MAATPAQSIEFLQTKNTFKYVLKRARSGKSTVTSASFLGIHSIPSSNLTWIRENPWEIMDVPCLKNFVEAEDLEPHPQGGLTSVNGWKMAM